MKHIHIKRWLLAATVVALVIAGAYASRDRFGTQHAQASTPTQETLGGTQMPATTGRHAPILSAQHAAPSIADVVEKAVPGVVNISAIKVADARGPAHADPFFQHPHSPFFGHPGKRRGRSLGSGVIVSSDGFVLTNSHVVTGGEDIRVTLADGREFAAEIVGNDGKTDLAVLELQGELGTLHPMKIGQSSDMRLGDTVLAIGNPFGVGQTVTMGIVSAKGRSGMGIVDYEDFIQTDAAINPGNSGGALINSRGELIGINTAILSRTGGYQGIGFAIPSDMAMPIMKDLIQDGTVSRGWLGVSIKTLDKKLAEDNSLDISRGVMVMEIVPESPAEAAGIQVGDVITRIGGTETGSAAQLSNAVALAGPDKTVEFAIMRMGEKRSIRVTLGDLSKSPLARK